jgi:transposase
MGGDHRSRLLDHRVAVLALIARQPDLTLEEIRRELISQHGISVGLASLWRFSAIPVDHARNENLHAAERTDWM